MICKHCGKEFEGRKRKYCSEECRHSIKNRTLHTLICCGCGQEYHHVNPKHKYCSLICAGRHNPSTIARKRKPCICVVCNKAYVPKAPDRTTCCSRECGFEYQRRPGIINREIEALRLIPKYESKIRVCKYCNKVYWIGKDGGVNAHCGKRECELAQGRERYYDTFQPAPPRSVTCKDCGVVMQLQGRGSRRDYCPRCSNARERATHKVQNRRRKMMVKGNYVEAINPLVVFARDKWTCKICGKKTIPHSKREYNPKAATIDHIIPLSKGGEHSYRNVQCACWECNSYKGNDISGKQLLLIG